MHLLFLFLNIWSSLLAPSLNVRDYGARGDGVTDDTQAINRCLQAAKAQQANVYIPAGIYLCNTVDASGNILTFDAGASSSLTIYGDGNGSVLTTSLNTGSCLLYIFAYAAGTGFTVKNISFQSTHGLITQQTRGLFITGTGAQNLSNVTVSGCYFNGFSTALGAQGINTFTVNSNYFGAPLGHDNAKNDTDPAVFLWTYDNANGRCYNITITNNTADGYTGTGPMSALVTHRPMDGFVFGTGYGYTITGNTTRDFSEEHYNLSPRTTSPNDSSLTRISNNYLDCSLVPGIANSDGSPHRTNYGIRCDISNVEITNNTLINYTYGIIVRAIEYPTTTLHRYVITGNQLHAATDTVNYDVTAGILVQSNNNPASEFRIMNNDIYTNLPDQPHKQRSIVISLTARMLRNLITNNTIHLIQ